MMNSMVSVAKVIIINEKGELLSLTRAKHPYFGDDIDIPGGAQDDGENDMQTAIREVSEEIGIDLQPTDLKKIYTETLSGGVTHHTIFLATIDSGTSITLSWEHSSNEWLPGSDFIRRSYKANDTFMHMAAKVAEQNVITK
jgi:8-oxo-dGTP pyrophosphatase MutT (NUDIX family)